jgi:predicted acetyltransferase
MRPLAREQGLRWIDVVADLGNIASQKVAVNNGAELVGRIDKGEAHAHLEALLFRIRLD